MRKAVVLLFMILAVALSGCVSEAELEVQDIQKCKSFGFKPGTEAFAKCRQKLYIARTKPPPVIQQPMYPYPPSVIVVPQK